MQIIDEVDETLAKLMPALTLILELTTPAGQSAKFKISYVGYIPEQFILLRHPDPNNKNTKFANYLQHATYCTVRGVVEGHEGLIIAFQTKITSILTNPTRMLVLAIPKKIAVQHLRKVTRIDTDIEVECKIKRNVFVGAMENLSPMGCLLDLHNIPKTFALKEQDPIEIKIDDRRFAKTNRIQGTICNVKVHAQGEHLGIRFEDVTKDKVMTLINQVLFHPNPT